MLRPSVRGAAVLRGVQRGLLACGALALGVWTLATLEAAWFDLVQTRSLERYVSSSAEETSATDGGARLTAARTGLVGRIEIPRVGVSAIIAEGEDSRTLRHAVGHVPGSAFPGERGNVALAGHRDGLFRGLREIRPGDVIRITTPDGHFTYRVISTEIVPPDRRDVLSPTTVPTVTLVTCYPFDFLGPAPLRLVVRGGLQAKGGVPGERTSPGIPRTASGSPHGTAVR